MKTENECGESSNRICFQMESFLDLDLAVAVNRGHGDISERLTVCLRRHS